MIFESIATERGCRSYLVGCPDTCQAAVIDPEISQLDRYLALAARDGLRIRYLIDSHTHADHFSGSRQLSQQLGVPVVMHRASPAPFVDLHVDDGEMIVVGPLRLTAIHTPGHTTDSMCLQAEDRLFTGDTHLTEALRTNMNGGKTIAQLLAEAAAHVPFMSLAELKAQVEGGSPDMIVLDLRERDAYVGGHIPGARLLPRGQLELRVNQELPDPTKRIVTCCELGRISTLAAATLKELGFQRVVALDGGMQAWREAGYPLKTGAES